MRKHSIQFLLAAVLALAALASCTPTSHPSGEETIEVESVTLEPAAIKLAVGKEYQLTATVLPEKAAKTQLSWESTNTRSATVSRDGVIKGHVPGTAKIRVYAGAKSAECHVTVIQDHIPITSLSLLHEMDVEQGREYAIRPVIIPTNATGTALLWKSSDPSVATVRGHGIVTGEAPGETTITATTTDGSNLSATCLVRVHKPGPYNVIMYKSVDGKVVQPYYPRSLGTVVSNEYGFEWGTITLKDKLLTLGGSAFQDCNLLTEVVLPARLTAIEGAAFRNCLSLLFINIPDEVSTIGNEAFYLCESLTSITLPKAVTHVGTGAFSRCPNLGYFHSPLATPDGRCLVLGGSVVAFAPAGLTGYELPESVSGIGHSAFMYCRELASLTVPATVTSIGEYAFLNCSALSSLTLLGEVPPALGSKAFEGTGSLLQIRVPASALETYRKAPGWALIASRIVPAE